MAYARHGRCYTSSCPHPWYAKLFVFNVFWYILTCTIIIHNWYQTGTYEFAQILLSAIAFFLHGCPSVSFLLIPFKPVQERLRYCRTAHQVAHRRPLVLLRHGAVRLLHEQSECLCEFPLFHGHRLLPPCCPDRSLHHRRRHSLFLFLHERCHEPCIFLRAVARHPAEILHKFPIRQILRAVQMFPVPAPDRHIQLHSPSSSSATVSCHLTYSSVRMPVLSSAHTLCSQDSTWLLILRFPMWHKL